MLKRISLVSTLLLVLAVCGLSQTPQAGSDVLLVLPFENISGKAEFNWVGESFADSLSDLLKVPGLTIVSNEQRKLIQQRLRVPLSTIPSLATSLKLARESQATLLIAGRYTIIPASGDNAATINVTAKIVRVNEGRFMSEFIDGKQVTRDINFNDALGNLQTMQGQIAYQILYQRDKSLPFSQNQLIEAASKVPARAFEAYIKGLLTNDLGSRENYFKNASRLFTDAQADGVYSEAELELGHLYLAQRKGVEAINSFEKVISANQRCHQKARADKKPAQCSDESFAEASFYIGLMFLQQGNFESAMATLQPLAEDLKLTTVYNALGAISVQASRAEKKNPSKAAAQLTDGISYLKKAAESSPDNTNVRFNYGVALFLMGDFKDAAEQFRSAIILSPRDGEAYYLLAKTLELIKDPAATDMDNQARRYLTEGNRYATLEAAWQKDKQIPAMSLRVEQPARKDFVAVVLSRKPAATGEPQLSETDALLSQARTLYKNGQDDEAMATLRRVLASEPMSAESYLLLGKISLRRGDIDQAVSQLKTSIFWDNRLIDAHIALGRIYVDKKDCLQAKNYTASALELGPENQDALALQRLSERCSK